MFAGAMLILFGVVGVALYSLKRGRRGREISERRVLVGWGLGFPIAVLALLMAFAFLRGEQLLARSGDSTPEIRVTARQWSWTFDYPGGLRTVNALHVPAGQRFRLRLVSEDVIHSFWVPRLGGKMDAIPGHENLFMLQADVPGFHRGICAEYCGIGHAHMPFEVHVHASGDYQAALAAAAAAPPPEPWQVLEQRRSPAADAIENMIAYSLRWIGLGR